MLAHAVQVTSDDIRILHKHNVPLAHCPKSNAKFGHGIAPLAHLLKSGLTVGLGTDSAASNNRLDLFEEARFALLQARGAAGRKILDEQKMLEMMTIDGAKAMGLGNEIGSLEPGKKADFIIVRLPFQYSDASQVLNHLIYSSVANDLLASFINGAEVDLKLSEADR